LLFRTLCLAVLFALPAPAQAAGYLVRPGDTLGAIAKGNGVSIRALAHVNGISDPNLVRIGQYLVIPTAVRVFRYHVHWGDTLLGIGARYGMSVGAIRSMNPRLGIYPLAGEWLRVCTGCSSGGTYTLVHTSPSSTGAGGTSSRTYVVQPGDNLSGIAARFGVTTAAVTSVNNLSNRDLVVIGTQLRIPGSVTQSYAPVAYDPWTARALIVQFAQTYGIDPALPLGIGWQESGFNENMISGTGAIGVMQVEPYTGVTISNLLGRQMDLHNVRDNVQSGVFWIANLLRYYGGNERLAVAAYYQGSRSLAHHGFYGDTYQYVANVLALKARFGG
jgi:N-acetylmuramoyl-L-alanine amidase